MRRNFSLSGVLLAAVVLAALILPGRSWAEVTCQANPALVRITLGYHGLPVEIKGNSAPGDDVIVKVSSLPEDLHLKYKGKAGGIFWMKLGTLIFQHAPSVYLLSSSSPINTTLSPEIRGQNIIGLDALQRRIGVSAEHGPLPPGDWFAQLLAFKKRDKVYASTEGNVILDPQGGYSLSLDWPYKAAPGKYKIEVYTAHHGMLTGSATSEMSVEMTGVVKQISDMSFNKRGTYGLIAIVVALVVGFAVGNIFKGGGAH